MSSQIMFIILLSKCKSNKYVDFNFSKCNILPIDKHILESMFRKLQEVFYEKEINHSKTMIFQT